MTSTTRTSSGNGPAAASRAVRRGRPAECAASPDDSPVTWIEDPAPAGRLGPRPGTTRRRPSSTLRPTRTTHIPARPRSPATTAIGAPRPTRPAGAATSACASWPATSGWGRGPNGSARAWATTPACRTATGIRARRRRTRTAAIRRAGTTGTGAESIARRTGPRRASRIRRCRRTATWSFRRARYAANSAKRNTARDGPADRGRRRWRCCCFRGAPARRAGTASWVPCRSLLLRRRSRRRLRASGR